MESWLGNGLQTPFLLVCIREPGQSLARIQLCPHRSVVEYPPLLVQPSLDIFIPL